MSSSVLLSELLGRPVAVRGGEGVGKVSDVVVRLTSGGHPPVVGFAVSVGDRVVFVPVSDVATVTADAMVLTTARLDVRVFERREGEVLVRADILGHRLIDVAAVRLVRARDGEIVREGTLWSLTCLDTSSRRRVGALLKREPTHRKECRDWAEFEPLIGHVASADTRAPLSRLRRLRPNEIADLVEAARGGETKEILDAVHDDLELEADVFEEMEPDRQVEVLRGRDDGQIAELLAHMRPDDAADLLAELPQDRRLPVLGLVPAPVQGKIRVLLGFNAASAGGLMTPDVLTQAAETTAAAALDAVRMATTISDEVLMSIYVVDEGRLVGVLSLPTLVKAPPDAVLATLMHTDPVRVFPNADITEVAIRMTDFNLVSIPVVDADNRLLGVITVDDVLEITVPGDWWRRQEGTAEPRHQHSQANPPMSLTTPASQRDA